MKYKKIEISTKIDHEESDLHHYQRFMNDGLFNYNETKPTNLDQFLFFMSIGMLHGSRSVIENGYNNITAGKSVKDEYVGLITAISFAHNGTDNFNKPKVVAKEAEEFAKAGLHITLNELEEKGLDSFIKQISKVMVRRAELLKNVFDAQRVVDSIEDE